MPLPAGLPPSWVYPGAKFDMDFLNQRYWGIPAAKAITNVVPGIWDSCAQGLTGSLSSTALWAYDITGVFPTNGGGYRAGTGVWSFQDTTNACLYSRTFTNAAWLATNCTIAQNQTGADGTANGAGLLTATAGSGTATFLQSITLASNTVIGSFWMKRSVGTGTVSITVDGGATWNDVTAQFGATGFTGRVSSPTQTVTNPVFGIRLGTNGDAIIIDNAQCEYASTPANAALNLATTPLPTTSAPNQRFNQYASFNYPSGPNFNAGVNIAKFFNSGSPYSILFIGAGDPAIGTVTPYGSILVTDGNVGSQGGVGGNSFSFGGVSTANTANSGTAGIAHINKMLGATGGNGNYACLNGGTVAFTSSTGRLGGGMSHAVIGNNGSGSNAAPLNGYCQRITIWPYVLTQGDMQRFTT